MPYRLAINRHALPRFDARAQVADWPGVNRDAAGGDQVVTVAPRADARMSQVFVEALHTRDCTKWKETLRWKRGAIRPVPIRGAKSAMLAACAGRIGHSVRAAGATKNRPSILPPGLPKITGTTIHRARVPMRWQGLASLGVTLLLAAWGRGGVLPCAAPACPQAGYLVLPVEDAHGSHLQTVPYLPQPGDILLFDDENPFYHFLFTLRGAGPPVHVAIAFARADGTPALLDLTGPTVRTGRVSLLDVMHRLESYHGVILVRRLRTPLSPGQGADLCQFALAQQGKEFALGRMLLQGTPFCCRNGLRHYLFAGTCMNRERWLCSELVVAAATAAHILDPRDFPSNSIYPGDLAYDQKYDLSGLYQSAVLWVAKPPQEMRGSAEDVFFH
jgi:hypothetical protein